MYFFLASSLHSLWIGSAWKEESWPDVSWLEDLWEKERNNICFVFQNIFCWKSVQLKSHNCKQFSASKLDFILLLKTPIWEICSSDLQGVNLNLLAVNDHLILQVLHWPSTLLHYISLSSWFENRCRDPMNNDKDCPIGQLKSTDRIGVDVPRVGLYVGDGWELLVFWMLKQKLQCFPQNLGAKLYFLTNKKV